VFLRGPGRTLFPNRVVAALSLRVQATTDADEKLPGQHGATEAGVARSAKLEYRFRETADTREGWSLDR